MGKKVRCYEVIKQKWIWIDKEEIERFWKEMDLLVNNAKR
jgi:non-homologous end joining protein Ku